MNPTLSPIANRQPGHAQQANRQLGLQQSTNQQQRVATPLARQQQMLMTQAGPGGMVSIPVQSQAVAEGNPVLTSVQGSAAGGVLVNGQTVQKPILTQQLQQPLTQMPAGTAVIGANRPQTLDTYGERAAQSVQSRVEIVT